MPLSTDTLYDGELTCMQFKKGYRFSVDSVLLSHFHSVRKGDSVLDIGCGCGIIGLILAYRYRKDLKKVVGVELQPELAELAKRNVEINGYDQIVGILRGDIREIRNFSQPESFSGVVCNPPFYKELSGRKSQNEQERIARHQVRAELDDIIACAGYTVRNKGLVSMIYPAEGLAELMNSMIASRLQPKRLQLVYSYPSSSLPARLVLVEAIKNGGEGLFVEPPFYIYQEKEGDYSAEMKRFYLPNKKG